LIATGAFAKIIQEAFNAPIVVNDYMQFAMLSQKYKTNILLVYCDPKDKRFPRVYQSLAQARKKMPINLKPDKHGDVTHAQRH